MRPGKLIVISAPSGGGKTTICDRVLKQDKQIVRSISATTRERRGRERHGRDYFFLSDAAFKRHIQEGRFLEWAEVHGHCYGTLKHAVAAQQKKGRDVALVIDVQGGLAVRKIDPQAVLIFIRPPSFAVLERRLRDRKTDDARTIRQRLSNARGEMQFIHDYDYVIVNDRLEKAVEALQAILIAERMRVAPRNAARKNKS